jgi:hypothetical protein
MISKIPYGIEYKKYENYNRLFLNINHFIEHTIEINKNIRYLPTFLYQLKITKFNIHVLIENISGYLFVYIHSIILIIPGYLVSHFSNFPILNLKLDNINYNNILDINTIKKIKEYNLFKLLSSGNDFTLDNDEESFVACLIIKKFDFLTIKHLSIINKFINIQNREYNENGDELFKLVINKIDKYFKKYKGLFMQGELLFVRN